MATGPEYNTSVLEAMDSGVLATINQKNEMAEKRYQSRIRGSCSVKGRKYTKE